MTNRSDSRLNNRSTNYLMSGGLGVRDSTAEVHFKCSSKMFSEAAHRGPVVQHPEAAAARSLKEKGSSPDV